MATAAQLRDRSRLTPSQCVQLHGGSAHYYRKLFHDGYVAGELRGNRIWILQSSLDAFLDSRVQTATKRPNVRHITDQGRKQVRAWVASKYGAESLHA